MFLNRNSPVIISSENCFRKSSYIYFWYWSLAWNNGFQSLRSINLCPDWGQERRKPHQSRSNDMFWFNVWETRVRPAGEVTNEINSRIHAFTHLLRRCFRARLPDWFWKWWIWSDISQWGHWKKLVTALRWTIPTIWLWNVVLKNISKVFLEHFLHNYHNFSWLRIPIDHRLGWLTLPKVLQ